MVFPLPLVPFEYYMLAYDRPRHPMSFFIRLVFDGHFQRPAFEASLERALERHPLLRAVVRSAGGRRMQWVAAEQQRASVCWRCGDRAAEDQVFTGIDLQRDPGLRIVVRENDDDDDHNSDVLWQFHHACCDGLGAMRFIEDVLAEYHRQCDQTDSARALRPIDPQRLRHRGRFGLTPIKRLLRLPLAAVHLHGLYQYSSHRAAPLPCSDGLPAEGAGVDLPPTVFPAFCRHTLSAEQTQRFRRAASELGVTVNDLLLRDLLLALRDFCGDVDEGNYLRIMVPVNMRTAADGHLPAANVVSMVSAERLPGDLDDPQRALELVRLRMNKVKRYRLGLTLIHMLEIVGKWPGGIPWLLRDGRTRATTVMSNMADPTGQFALPRRDGYVVAGDVTLRRVEVLPPLRPLTRATFGIVTYVGRLTITLHHDPRCITSADAERLLGHFVRRIEESAAAETVAGAGG